MDFNRLFEVCNELIRSHISSELKPTVLGWVFFSNQDTGRFSALFAVVSVINAFHFYINTICYTYP